VSDQNLTELSGTGDVTGDQPPPASAFDPRPPPLPYWQPPTAPPATKPRRTGRLLLVIGLIVVLILAALAGGAVLANASLSSNFSPEKAVTDYLAAQKRGDASFMIASGNYLQGDGSYSQYFNKDELAVMMTYPQNTDISDVRVTSTTEVDSNTRTVNVTMIWNGHQVQPAFTVHKDPTRVHYLFFNSWLIDIPFVSIHVTLPNQPGSIAVDGFPLPAGAATSDIHVIQGFHKVTVSATDLYDSYSANADGIASEPSVVVPSKIGVTALASAARTIKQAFSDKACTTAKYFDCLNHTYHSPNQAGLIYYYNMPGYGEVDYTTYEFTLTGDPTVKMQVAVEANAGKVSASGVCADTMTVDGNRHYHFKGTWQATLTTSSGGGFGYDLVHDCEKSEA
jgi:archaellum component FlaF (FlaF/FlaG flagellin family)